MRQLEDLRNANLQFQMTNRDLKATNDDLLKKLEMAINTCKKQRATIDQVKLRKICY